MGHHVGTAAGLLVILQRKRCDAVRAVAFDTIGGEDRRDIAAIGGGALGRFFPGFEEAANRFGTGRRHAGLGGNAVNDVAQFEFGDLIAQRADGGEAVVDTAAVDNAVVRADDEGFRRDLGFEARGEIALDIKQDRKGGLVGVAHLADIVPGQRGIGEHAVEFDLGVACRPGHTIELGQVAA